MTLTQLLTRAYRLGDVVRVLRLVEPRRNVGVYMPLVGELCVIDNNYLYKKPEGFGVWCPNVGNVFPVYSTELVLIRKGFATEAVEAYIARESTNKLCDTQHNTNSQAQSLGALQLPSGLVAKVEI